MEPNCTFTDAGSRTHALERFFDFAAAAGVSNVRGQTDLWLSLPEAVQRAMRADIADMLRGSVQEEHQ